MKANVLFAAALAFVFQGGPANAGAKIDRYALVSRHNVTLSEFNALSPLSVGNGKFAFTADLTGLQTFASLYDNGIPLTTMAEWGWHSFVNTENFELEDTFELLDTYGRKVPYNIIRKSPAAEYLRANPHQTNLAQIGFVLLKADGSQAFAEDIKNPRQILNLWEGILKSSFQLDNEKVEVETFCHPLLDMVAVDVRSRLIKSGRLGISLKFPYASGDWGPNPSSWENPDRHITRVIKNDQFSGSLFRQMDDLRYYCTIKCSQKSELREVSKHNYQVIPSGKADSLQLCVLLSKGAADLSGVDFKTAQQHCKNRWKRFWTTGGAVDLSQSKDPGWKELERRIVLSQYLTAI